MSTTVSTVSGTSNLFPRLSHTLYHFAGRLQVQMAYIEPDQKIQKQPVQWSSAALEAIRLNAIGFDAVKQLVVAKLETDPVKASILD